MVENLRAMQETPLLLLLFLMSSKLIHVVASVKILRLYNIPFYLYTMLLLLLLLSRFICV